MNKQGRLENSVKNSALGILVQCFNVLLGIVVRTIFIKTLGEAYLGVNGLFSNILTMLSLAELGIGTAIIYNMYKPIANDDQVAIAKLMNLYKKTYNIIGIVVAIIGIVVIPFLKYIVSEQTNIENITIIYILYLCNTVFSYFFAYKRSIFSADQKERILHIFKLIFYFIRSIFQILILLLFKNFILYLLIQIACTLLENICVSIWANKRYPFLLTYQDSQLSENEKKSIFDDVKSLSIYKIGGVVLDGTDNIIISIVEGVISVGLLSNYTLITGSVQTFLSQITSSLTGSIGNYIAKEKRERYESLLNNVTFLHFIIYGAFFVVFSTIFNSFIKIWIGESFILSNYVVFVICLNVYIYGMMNSVWTFRSTMGLFRYGKWRPLVSAFINLAVSILLANYLGLIGVLLGTTITRLLTNVWYDPYVVYKYGLKKKPYKYYLLFIKYTLVCIVDIFLLIYIDRLLNLSGVLGLIIYIICSLLVFFVSVIVFFCRTQEYRYCYDLLKSIFLKLFKFVK